MENKITVVIVEPGKPPYEKEVDNTLEALQEIVDGNIETTWDPELPEGVAIVVNEEGKILRLPVNRFITNDILCGTFFVCGLGEEDFISLTPEQVEKVIEFFE